MRERAGLNAPPTFEFDAFISYSEKKRRRLAARVERALRQIDRADDGTPGIRVFIDNSDLGGQQSLPDAIKRGLDRSRHLVVLHSDRAEKSRWVRQEIDLWREVVRPDRKLLLVLTDRRWTWDRRARNLAGPAGKPSVLFDGLFADEPRYIDLRPVRWFQATLAWPYFREQMAQLAVGIGSMRNARELAQREERVQRRQSIVRTFVSVALAAAVALAGGILAGDAEQKRQARIAGLVEQSRSDPDQVAATGAALRAFRQDSGTGTAAALRERLARSTLVAALPSGNNVTSAVAFTADGTRLVLGGFDGLVTLWDTTDESVPAYVGSVRLGRYIRAATFSPDGTRLVVGENDGRVDLIAVSGAGAPRLVRSFDSGVGRIAATVVDARTGLLVVGGVNGFRLWDLSPPGAPRQIPGRGDRPHPVRDVAAAPDASVIAVVDETGTITRWNLAVPSAPVEIDAAPRKAPRTVALAYSPDGRRVAAAGDNGRLTVWDIGSKHTDQWQDTSDSLVDVVFLTADRLLAGGDARAMTVWRLSAGHTRDVSIPLAGGMQIAYALAVTGHGSRIAVGGANQVPALLLRTADLVTSAQGKSLTAGGAVGVFAAGLTGGVAWGGRTGRLYRATTRGDHPVGPSSRTVEGVVTALAFDGGGRLAYGTSLGKIVVVRPDGSETGVAGSGPSVRGLVFLDDGRELAWLDADGRISFASGDGFAARTAPVGGEDDRVLAIARGPAPGTLVVGHARGSVALLSRDGETGRRAGPSGVVGVAVASSGLVGVAREDGAVAFMTWDGRRLNPAGEVYVSESAVRSVAFSADGTLALATATQDRATLISTAGSDFHVIADVPTTDKRATAAAFTGTGTTFVTAGEDGAVGFGDAGPLRGMDRRLTLFACLAVGGQSSPDEWQKKTDSCAAAGGD